MTIYNYKGGPCYRCLFPVPPDPSTVQNCNDGGVLGVVTGIVGSLQALQVLNIIMDYTPEHPKLLLFDAQDTAFRSVKLRTRNADCVVCGDNPTVLELIDYNQFCSSTANDKPRSVSILDANDRISCSEYKSILNEKSPHVLIDVRPKIQFDICSLQNAVNVPLSELEDKLSEIDTSLPSNLQ